MEVETVRTLLYKYVQFFLDCTYFLLYISIGCYIIKKYKKAGFYMLMNIKEASEYLHVAQGTLRRWEREGLIKPSRTEGGHRRYSEEDLLILLSKKGMISSSDKYTIGYCRVSLHKQKDDLERQVENVNIYICLRI